MRKENQQSGEAGGLHHRLRPMEKQGAERDSQKSDCQRLGKAAGYRSQDEGSNRRGDQQKGVEIEEAAECWGDSPAALKAQLNGPDMTGDNGG